MASPAPAFSTRVDRQRLEAAQFTMLDGPKPPMPPASLNPAQGTAIVVQNILSHKQMVALARQYTPEAISAIIAIMRNPKSGALVIAKCAELLLAYGWGRPPQSVAVSMDAPTPGLGLSALPVHDRVRAIQQTYLGRTLDGRPALLPDSSVHAYVPQFPVNVITAPAESASDFV